MKSKLNWIMTLFLAFFIQMAFAQEKTVNGVVTDEEGLPLPGVGVVVQGTTRGTQTDFDGKYSLKAAVGEKLVFSFVSMDSQTVTVGASNTISVQMKMSSKQLVEVVVEGYNITRPKAKSNLAVTTVSAATIEQRPNASFIQTLQSQVAGLNISTGSGQPGAQSFVLLRGYTSINGNVEPLYVIDGVPLNSDSFRSINPNDIASVSVLKDAAATSKYGNRANAGVIVVTTRKGSFEQATKIKYSVTSGFSKFQGTDYNMMNSQQVTALERNYAALTGQANVGVGTALTDAQLGALPTTNWNNFFFRTGFTQNHNLSIEGGGKNLAAFTSLGVMDQQGILKNTDLKRFSFRNNMSGKSSNGKFTYQSNITANFSRRNEAGSIGTGGVNQNFLLGANQSLPYITPEMWGSSANVFNQYSYNVATGAFPIPDPTFVPLYGGALSQTLALTPLFLIDKMKTYKLQTDEIKAVVYLEANYNFAKNFTFGVNQGIDYTQGVQYTFQDPVSLNSFVFQNQGEVSIGFETHAFSRDVALTTNTHLNYNKSFGKHTLDITAYTEYFKSHFTAFNFSQNGLDPKTSVPGAGTGYVQDNGNDDFNVPTVGASRADRGLFSYFAVADYDFDGRFGLGGTIRRDASSRFATSNRWGTFWSVSGRWNLDKEAFLQNTFVNMLKLRGSWGTNGNDLITAANYGELDRIREHYVAGTGYQGLPAYFPDVPANDDLKWETVTQIDLGIDFAMFNNKFTGTIDVYDKTTSDLYLTKNLSLVTGVSGIPANFGTMYNRGAELTLSYDLIKTNNDGFNLTLRGNGSYNKNRVTDIIDEDGFNDDGSVAPIAENHDLNEWYMIRYAGVNPVNGELLFKDKNGELTETPDESDRVWMGKSSLPKFQGGFGFDADYKGFFFNTQFSFVTDVWRYDYDLSGLQDPSSIGTFNKSTDILRAWTPDNRVTDIPALNFSNGAYDALSDRYLRDASYLRLRYTSLGYQVPAKFLDRTPFSMVKAFIQAENLVTWSKWRGWDAESSRGSDQYQYPTPRIVSVGLQLEF